MQRFLHFKEFVKYMDSRIYVRFGARLTWIPGTRLVEEVQVTHGP